ncbi:MAG TPA: DUF4760 domain-containing protein [Planctomycetota bacterium]|nr:DUF4760 domain-containing protein [Planctomycetota bacterium]
MSEYMWNVMLVVGTWAGIFAALYAVWMQNNNERLLTSVQLFLQLAQQFDSDEMERKRVALAKALLKNPKDVEIDDTVLSFFENVAYLIRRGLLEDGMSWNFFSLDVIFLHHASTHYIQHMRQKFNAQDLFQEFETLALRWQGKPYKNITVNESTTTEFLRWSSRMTPEESF